jgi:Fe-Mn family superoxide dismutase
MGSLFEWIDLVEDENTTKKKETDVRLKKLPVSRDGLTPVMSKATVDYHYGKLAKGYVDRYNNKEGDSDFNYAGAVLHNTFFEQFRKAKNSNKPTGISLEVIEDKHKSFAEFKETFTQTAKDIQGSGWCYVDNKGNIKIIKNHATRANIALIVDMWEHAWALDYKANKDKYLANIWRIVDWDVINKRIAG